MASLILSRITRPTFNSNIQVARKPKPRLKQETIFERKQAKRLATVNTFTQDFTNQKLPGNFFNPKRIRAIGNYLQRATNSHRFTLPIDPAVKAELTKKFVQNQHYLYYKFRNEQHQHRQFVQAYQESNILEEFKTIPDKISEAPILQDREFTPMPTVLSEFRLYKDQLKYAMPEQEYQRKKYFYGVQRLFELGDGNSTQNSKDDPTQLPQQ